WDKVLQDPRWQGRDFTGRLIDRVMMCGESGPGDQGIGDAPGPACGLFDVQAKYDIAKLMCSQPGITCSGLSGKVYFIEQYLWPLAFGGHDIGPSGRPGAEAGGRPEAPFRGGGCLNSFAAGTEILL